MESQGPRELTWALTPHTPAPTCACDPRCVQQPSAVWDPVLMGKLPPALRATKHQFSLSGASFIRHVDFDRKIPQLDLQNTVATSVWEALPCAEER